MKKTILILVVMLTVSHLTLAQRVVGDSIYISHDSLHFKLGDQIALGNGSNPDGDFKFIYTNPFWGTGKSSKLPALFDSYDVIVKRIKKFGSDETGYKYFLVAETGGYGHYWIDIEQALQSGEVLKQSSKHFKNMSSTKPLQTSHPNKG